MPLGNTGGVALFNNTTHLLLAAGPLVALSLLPIGIVLWLGLCRIGCEYRELKRWTELTLDPWLLDQLANTRVRTALLVSGVVGWVLLDPPSSPLHFLALVAYGLIALYVRQRLAARFTVRKKRPLMVRVAIGLGVGVGGSAVVTLGFWLAAKYLPVDATVLVSTYLTVIQTIVVFALVSIPSFAVGTVGKALCSVLPIAVNFASANPSRATLWAVLVLIAVLMAWRKDQLAGPRLSPATA